MKAVLAVLCLGFFGCSGDIDLTPVKTIVEAGKHCPAGTEHRHVILESKSRSIMQSGCYGRGCAEIGIEYTIKIFCSPEVSVTQKIVVMKETLR